ncbi:hypothetical protein SAMN05216387_101172 [Nitrosovibrio tenuis]|uniref:Uncharacterized protein n=1 Tax=Nitrosovibrio tenuis TaxID=1233 RepID=A0A1H7G3V1_9PROT|nr:hypothetical protein SAMN05216387_101172 [Nitrosovibrio tenuis]
MDFLRYLIFTFYGEFAKGGLHVFMTLADCATPPLELDAGKAMREVSAKRNCAEKGMPDRAVPGRLRLCLAP